MKTIEQSVHLTAHAGGRGSGMNAPIVELDAPERREGGGEYRYALLLTEDDVRKRFGLVMEAKEGQPASVPVTRDAATGQIHTAVGPTEATRVLTSTSEPVRGGARVDLDRMNVVTSDDVGRVTPPEEGASGQAEPAQTAQTVEDRYAESRKDEEERQGRTEGEAEGDGEAESGDGGETDTAADAERERRAEATASAAKKSAAKKASATKASATKSAAKKSTR